MHWLPRHWNSFQHASQCHDATFLLEPFPGHAQVCREVGNRPVWRIRTGPMVPLAEGCFLQGQVANLGPLATAFIQRAFPLFSAPWRVKLALEAAGVPGCTEVTPAAVR